jgi:hypothetical protein
MNYSEHQLGGVGRQNMTCVRTTGGPTPVCRWYLIFVRSICVIAAAVLIAGCSKEQAETLTVAYSNDLKGTIRSCGCPVNYF